ncbi:hypothetical protein NDU88_006326 [Pleurodeles waltl]|uniref:Uncharacterized protein n=1 Tax=Pleurodeles waltl TaxID=8319 RepID=A0AAV7LP97_PLEWA|nr:hypothetical protein NDU88_006326 [Pleurodeles waltl]
MRPCSRSSVNSCKVLLSSVLVRTDVSHACPQPSHGSFLHFTCPLGTSGFPRPRPGPALLSHFLSCRRTGRCPQFSFRAGPSRHHTATTLDSPPGGPEPEPSGPRHNLSLSAEGPWCQPVNQFVASLWHSPWYPLHFQLPPAGGTAAILGEPYAVTAEPGFGGLSVSAWPLDELLGVSEA